MIPAKRTSIGFISVAVILILAVSVFGRRGSNVRAAFHPVQNADAQARQGEFKEAVRRLPMNFEVNRGQADDAVKFIARGHGYQVFLTEQEAVLVLQNQVRDLDQNSERPRAGQSEIRSSALRFKVEGQTVSEPTGFGLLPGKSNYLIGNDPQKWHKDIPNYSRVEYREVSPGVTLAYYGTQRALEYDFIVAPGADPSQITMTVEGAEKLELAEDGDLILHVGGERVFHRSPVSYQQIGGKRRAVNSRYVLRGGNQTGWQIGFEVSDYDAKQQLVIDPVIDFSTFFGGIGSDEGLAIAVDSSGSAYVTGTTYSNNFNTFAPLQTINRGGKFDSFVAKLNPSGTGLVYSTYLGGSGEDTAAGIAVDAAGNAVVVGTTNSTDFNTRNALQPNLSFVDDAFVTKVNATGTELVFSTYLGGSSSDLGFGVTVDAAGDAYVTGSSASTNFPLRLPLQNINRGGNDAFITKIKGDGSQLIYSTYLGGSLLDEGYGITVDAGGNAYVAGGTASTNFNTVNPFQPNIGGGGFDVFLAKINAIGSQLIYSTYLGGSLVDVAYDVAVDANNNAYITGHTFSTDFPTQNPLQATNGGEADAFIARFNVGGSGLIYSTYVGGSAGDFARGIVVDSASQPVIAGRTASTNFATRNPLQATNRGNFDAFVTKLNNTGGQFVYSTYLGGASDDLAFGIAQDAANNVYVTGDTRSTDFNTKNPLQANNRGGLDAFVSKLNGAGTDLTYSTYLGGSGEDLASSIALDTAGNAYITGYTSSNDYPARNSIQETSRGGLEVFVTKIFADASDIAYNTYFGGNGSDTANSIAVDTSGSCYITGATTSTNFPVRNPIQANNRGGLDAFVAKINPAGTNLVYSTYLGGGFGDGGRGIAIDSNGNAFVVGSTFSENFPTNAAFQATNRGLGDAFVTRINASGTSLVYSSFLGGGNTDEAAGIAVDASGNAYIVGNTASNDFNTRAPLQANNRGQQDIFVTKVNPSGSTLIYSTYLGGGRADLGNGIAIDQSGAAYITGSTISANFPTLSPRQPVYGGGEQDAFVSKINATGTALVFSTYLGGLLTEVGNAIAVDPLGNAYVTGVTSSTDFPLKNPLQADNRGLNEAFITKYNQQGSDFVYSTYLGGSNSDQGTGIAVNAAGTAYVAGATSSANFNIQFPLVAYGGGTDVFVAKILSEPSLLLTPGTLELQAASAATMTVSISAGQAQPVTVTLTSSAPNLASVPATVTIPANATTTDFAVTGVAVGGPVTITAALSQALGGATATATVNVITSSRFINAGSVSVAAGGLATIPIDLISQGNENRLTFSLSLDAAVVTSTPFFTLGADATASGATLTTVPQAAQGRYGIIISLPAGQTFDAGTRQILVVQPIVATGSGVTSTPIAFTDAPTVRRVTDINGQTLSANYAPGTLTIASGYEGDVSPRPNGSNGTVTISDWVQTGRFAAGFDTVNAGSEFQRADCAPRAALGNGAITISDWVQAGRYASALDPVVPAGGPTGPAFSAPPALGFGEPAEAAQTRIVRVTSLATQRGQQFTTFVEIDSLGNENAFGFSINFDTTQLNLVSATAGPDVNSASLNVNSSQAAQGRLGVALALPTGATIAAGSARKLVALTFNLPANSTANTLNLNFGDQPIPREIVSANADSLSATFINGTIFVAKAVTSVSAASFAGGDLAPEQIVAAFGEGLATTIQVNNSLPLPTTLGGTTVKVRDSAGVERSAGLFFVAPNQVNYLVPAGTANGAAIVTVTSGNNTLSVGTVNIAATAPGLFTSNASGQGLAAATVFRIAANGAQTFEPVGQFNAATGTFTPIPIDLGPAGDQVFLLLFGTGFRNSGLANVGVRIGGTTSEVLYAADAPGFVGLDQCNARIPRTLIGRGEVDVMMTVGAKTANTVKISIK